MGENFSVINKVLIVVIFLMIVLYSSSNVLFTLDNGYILAPAVLMLILGIIGALCFAYVVFPEKIARWFARHTALDLKKFTHVLALGALILVLFYVFGMILGFSTALMFESIYLNNVDPSAAFHTAESGLLLSAASSLFFMMVLPIAYVRLVRGTTIKETLAALKFKKEGVGKALIFGVAGVIMLVILIIIVGLIMFQVGFEEPDNEGLEQMVAVMTMPLVLVLSLCAAVSEEFLFRGFIQQKIGLIGASVLFGLVHLSYLNVLQVVFPAVMGLILGWILIKTDNLIAPITAHFLYDLWAFTMAMYAF